MIAAWFLMSAAACWCLGFPVYNALRARGIVDKPNERSSHTRPTVRGGGIAIMFTVTVGAVVMAIFSNEWRLVWLMGAAVLIAAVSFWDDLHSLPPAARFGCHAFAAGVVLMLIPLNGPVVALDVLHEIPLPPVLAAGAVFLWITGYTNAFNFMDGINGIAGAQAALAGLGMALLSGMATGEWSSAPLLFALVLGGAGVGFLPHNFPKARMFMGDVGSAPLGFLLSAVTIWLAGELGWWLLVPLLLMHANFIMDTAITLLRRMLAGEKWYHPHREHFYQRLIRGSIPQRRGERS